MSRVSKILTNIICVPHTTTWGSATLSENSCSIVTQPEIVPVSGKDYKLVSPFVCRINDLEFVVFEGFVFDGASIPRIAWSLLGLAPVGPHLAAACIHDLLYESRGLIPEHKGSVKLNGERVRVRFTRKQSDEIFRDILKVSCLSSFRVDAMYRAVRWFGAKAWNT
jgi:hypothetical protein